MLRTSNRTGVTAAVGVALLAVFLAYVGNFHFVYGSGVSLRKVPKVSWSLPETLINADEVKGTPPLLLRARFPLFVQAAEQLGN